MMLLLVFAQLAMLYSRQIAFTWLNAERTFAYYAHECSMALAPTSSTPLVVANIGRAAAAVAATTNNRYKRKTRKRQRHEVANKKWASITFFTTTIAVFTGIICCCFGRQQCYCAIGCSSVQLWYIHMYFITCLFDMHSAVYFLLPLCNIFRLFS